MKFCKEIKKHLNNKTNKRLFPVTEEVNNSSIFFKKSIKLDKMDKPHYFKALEINQRQIS